MASLRIIEAWVGGARSGKAGPPAFARCARCAAIALLIILLGAQWAAGATTTTASATATGAFTLDNGLRVRLIPTDTAQRVAVAMAYDVGYRDEPLDRRGLAHLAEHLTFRRTQHLAAAHAAWAIVEGMGGSTNGWTGPSDTIYLAEGPSHRLRTLLWLERERMAFVVPALTEADVDAEKNIVIQEILERNTLSRRRLRYEMATFYPVLHPLVPTARETQEVARHTPEDVAWFLNQGYRPARASLVVVGAFDVPAARRWVHDTFGDLSAPTSPRRAPAEPPKLRARRMEIRHAVRQEEVRLTWVRSARTDWGTLVLLDQVVTDRLTRHAIARECISVAMTFSQGRHEEIIVVSADLAASTKIAPFTTRLVAAVDRILRQPISEREYQAARAHLHLRALRRSARPGRYALHAASALMRRRPTTVAEERAATARVTTADLDRLAHTLLETPRLLTTVAHEPGRYHERVERSAEVVDEPN